MYAFFVSFLRLTDIAGNLYTVYSFAGQAYLTDF